MIRKATAQDAPAIAAFWNPMIQNTSVTFNSQQKTAADIAEMITERAWAGHGFWVAELDQDVVGFVTYAQFRGGVGYAHAMEHTIILSPSAQGHGLGAKLMDQCEAHAKAAGAHCMMAGVSSENAAGISFHSKMGYEPVAVIRQVGRKFDRWMDLHLMQKFL